MRKNGSGRNRRKMASGPWWAASPFLTWSGLAGLLVVLRIMLNVIVVYGWSLFIWVRSMMILLLKQQPDFVNFVNLMHWHPLISLTDWHAPLFLGLAPFSIFGWWGYGVTVVVLAIYLNMVRRVIMTTVSFNGKEHGAESFATTHEIKQTYKLIPDRVSSFSGIGGMPVSHVGNLAMMPQTWVMNRSKSKRILGFKTVANLMRKTVIHNFQYSDYPLGKYAIDTATDNSLIVGGTRSGKGQMTVLPLIDILSRAEEQSSMIINDPKQELYGQMYRTLKQRNYHVELLNMSDTSRSMSYNPLSVIISYAQEKNWDDVQNEVERLSTSIYVKGDGQQSGGTEAFFNTSAANLLNSIILALIDLANRHSDDSKSWDRVTLHNAYKMLSDLGSQEITIMTNGRPTGQTTELVEYFDGLRELNAAHPDSEGRQVREMAYTAFAQSKLSGSETAGSIYSTMMEGLKIYQQNDIARLTSLNSFDINQIGFPRILYFNLPHQFRNGRVEVAIYTAEGQLIESKRRNVNSVGAVAYPIKSLLNGKFEIVIKACDAYQRTATQFEVLGKTIHRFRQPKSAEILQASEALFNLNLEYSEQPTAIFMITPPDNPSYNQIVTFFIDQTWNFLNKMAANTQERKTYVRVHNIIDEFANVPKIPNMTTKVSYGLGQNLLFDIFIQSLSQLEIQYTKNEAETIRSNCANIIYILSNEVKTVKEISEALGQTTIMSTQHKRQGDLIGNTADGYGDGNSTGVDVMSAAEIMRLPRGSSIVLRTTRDTKTGKMIRNNPIYNHGRTKMPYSWTFLQQTLSTDGSADIDYIGAHQGLDLTENGYDFSAEYRALADGSQPTTDAADVVPSVTAEDNPPASDQQVGTANLLGKTQAEISELSDEELLQFGKQLYDKTQADQDYHDQLDSDDSLDLLQQYSGDKQVNNLREFLTDRWEQLIP